MKDYTVQSFDVDWSILIQVDLLRSNRSTVNKSKRTFSKKKKYSLDVKIHVVRRRQFNDFALC